MSGSVSEKLELYEALLCKWQKSINLVSRHTIDDAKQRHFEDSLQLLEHIEAGDKNIIDIGSGAGFPGLVLAIALPDRNVTLIESDSRKCIFLRNVSRETLCDVAILNERIEAVGRIEVDVVTARALASLSELIKYMKSLGCKKGLFLKGAMAQEEVDAALGDHAFSYDIFPSLTSHEGAIVRVQLT